MHYKNNKAIRYYYTILPILVLQYTDLLNLRLSFYYMLKNIFIKYMKIVSVKRFLLVIVTFC